MMNCVNEWLIRVVMTAYRNSNSVIRINNTAGDNFDVEGRGISGFCFEFFVVRYCSRNPFRRM